jgi:hypothetical protein
MIEGHVAQVLDSRTLVINRGTEHGVFVGMIFEVLDTTGLDIRDPETNETIGSVLRPKVRVKVIDVQAKLAVATTFHSRRRNVGGSGGAAAHVLAQITAPPRWIQETESFKTDDAAWEQIDEAESYVKAGDPVRQAIETPEELRERTKQ